MQNSWYQICQVCRCRQESPGFDRFPQVSQFVMVFCRYCLWPLSKKYLIRKTLYWLSTTCSLTYEIIQATESSQKTFSVPYPELFWSRYTVLGSQTQTPKLSKVLISGISFRHHSLSQSQWEQCFELFRMQNSQNFPVLCPWTPLRRAYSAPFHQTPQMHNGFSPCYACRKTGTLKKLMSFSRILLIFMNSVFLQN